MKRIFNLFRFPVAMLLVTSCILDFDTPYQELQEGYDPVYGTQEHAEIRLLAPRQVNNPGKIYVYQNYLLVNEIRQGIHIFDNSDPANPQNLAFIQVLGNSDMAIKDGTLYADHVGNLVALKTDFNTIEEQGRIKLQNWDAGLPPPSRSRFTCIDPAKGIVIGWTKSKHTNFDCYAHW